jgi:hypothetical protein
LFRGSFPAALALLRRRTVVDGAHIVDTPATRTEIVDVIGFPKPDEPDEEEI